MEDTPDIELIDIDKVIESKSKRAARIMPSFVKSFIKRLIHQDEINNILARSGGIDGKDFADFALREMNVNYSIEYLAHEKLKAGGRYIYVSNHPLGGLDGLALISAIGNEDIRFVVNDFLMFIKPLKKIFVPVNKVGTMGKDYIDSFEEAYLSDCDILYFPAGLCSRLINGEIKDPPWKSSFIRHSLKYNREIVPVYFNGRNSSFFYRLARIRKMLGIKFNIEMIFLPDEMFKQKNSHLQIIVGEPVSVESVRSLCNNSESGSNIKEAAEKIRGMVYDLAARIK